jgi:Ca2+-binding EF-hand superfamily protein
MSGVWALAAVVLLPGVSLAQDRHKPGDIPGPIDSLADLQDTAKILFKMADTNNDGQISQKEAVDVGNLLVGGFFFRADTNGDGVLTPEEAREAREQLFRQQPLMRYILEKGKPTNATQIGTTNQPGQPREPGQVARDVAHNPGQAIGNLLDTNHDRKISASELRQAVQTSVQTLFTAADTNQDGQLSPAELNQAIGDAARTAVQAVFQSADTDHNGALSQAEFGQLSLEELQRAQQIIANQIQRLRVPEPSNSPFRQIRSGATTTTQPAQVAPSPTTIVAPAPVTTAPRP